jgi:hypothetical protein
VSVLVSRATGRALVALAALATLVLAVPGFAGPAPAIDPDVMWDRAGCAENIVLARIVDAHMKAHEAGSCFIDSREYCRVDILEVLQGALQPKRVDGWFAGDPDSAWDLWARHRSAVGKLAVLFPESIDFHTVMRTGPDLPGRGVVVLDGIDDPALERMRLAIRRASLDTLLARAEAICFGGYRRGQSTEFIVRQWLSGERPQPPLLVWHPNGGSAETGKVLMFLERDADGRWQPVGNGAGELAVRGGRVVRFGRRLDDVIEEIRERSGAASTVLSSR